MELAAELGIIHLVLILHFKSMLAKVPGKGGAPGSDCLYISLTDMGR